MYQMILKSKGKGKTITLKFVFWKVPDLINRIIQSVSLKRFAI